MMFMAFYRCQKSLQVFVEAWDAATENRSGETLQLEANEGKDEHKSQGDASFKQAPSAQYVSVVQLFK
jgi:hypothetical protein